MKKYLVIWKGKRWFDCGPPDPTNGAGTQDTHKRCSPGRLTSTLTPRKKWCTHTHPLHRTRICVCFEVPQGETMTIATRRFPEDINFSLLIETNCQTSVARVALEFFVPRITIQNKLLSKSQWNNCPDRSSLNLNSMRCKSSDHFSLGSRVYVFATTLQAIKWRKKNNQLETHKGIDSVKPGFNAVRVASSLVCLSFHWKWTKHVLAALLKSWCSENGSRVQDRRELYSQFCWFQPPCDPNYPGTNCPPSLTKVRMLDAALHCTLGWRLLCGEKYPKIEKSLQTDISSTEDDKDDSYSVKPDASNVTVDTTQSEQWGSPTGHVQISGHLR